MENYLSYNKRALNFFRRNKGIATGLISLIVLLIFAVSPYLADHVYRNFIFQGFRIVWDYTIGLLPFPVLYLELIIIPFALYFYCKRFARKWISLLLVPLNLFGWIATFFLWMWGYNYCSSPVVKFDESREMTEEQLYEFGVEIAGSFSQPGDLQLGMDTLPDDGYFNMIETAVHETIKSHGICTLGDPDCCDIAASGTMRRFGVAGIYLPFCGQPYCDDSYLFKTKAFIHAHELAHAYGVTSEGEADFIAYTALNNILPASGSFYDDEAFRRGYTLSYAARLELLRTIRYQLYISNDLLKVKLDSLLPAEVQRDIKQIKNNALLYPEFFPGMQEAMNDRYLKAMGIEDGVKNYDRFVELVWQSRKQ